MSRVASGRRLRRTRRKSLERTPQPRQVVPADFWKKPLHLVAFGFGAGLSPYAPGTAGTFVGALLYLAMAGLPILWYLACVAFLFGVGIGLCAASARELGVHDHPAIVWDEIVGLLITMTAAPQGWVWLGLGIVAFRVFDILKPWPIRLLDRNVGGGLGIMLDDAVAGLLGLALLQALHLLSG